MPAGWPVVRDLLGTCVNQFALLDYPIIFDPVN